MNKIECPLPELLNMLITIQLQMKGRGREGVLAVASSSSQRKPKSRKRKRNILRANMGGSQIEFKGKEVQGKGNCYSYDQKGHWKRNYLDYLRSFKGNRLALEGLR